MLTSTLIFFFAMAGKIIDSLYQKSESNHFELSSNKSCSTFKYSTVTTCPSSRHEECTTDNNNACTDSTPTSICTSKCTPGFTMGRINVLPVTAIFISRQLH